MKIKFDSLKARDPCRRYTCLQPNRKLTSRRYSNKKKLSCLRGHELQQQLQHHKHPKSQQMDNKTSQKDSQKTIWKSKIKKKLHESLVFQDWWIDSQDLQ